jgi:multicomponent K+:H+ antiporter subunit D
MWPLCFWLPTTYAAASPPVASIFAILTKVGVYVVLRLWLLLFGEGAGPSAQFGGDWLFYGGMATAAFGMIGSLASQDMARLAAFSVLVSSGTVLAAAGMGQVAVTGGALFYLVSSTLGISAFFLLVELVERGREPGADVLAVTREAYGEGDEDLGEEEEVGLAIPATMGVLGLAFLGCALVIAGLPPLSGFIAKFALSTAAFNPSGMTAPGGEPVQMASWSLLALLILSGLSALIAMTRAGIRAFWAAPDRAVPRVRVIEMAPVAVLLILCVLQTIQAGPVMHFMQATAQALHESRDYVHSVLRPAERQAHGAGGT